MADYRTIEAGDTLPRGFKVVRKSDGGPVTTGTVNYYLKAKTGTNAGKWWRDSDQTWQATETANAMTHDADGSWSVTLTASPWTAGVAFLEYAKESGDLHIPVDRHLKAEYTYGAWDTGAVVRVSAGGVVTRHVPATAAAADVGAAMVAAKNAAAAGDTVYVSQDATLTASVAKNGVNWVFGEVTITANADVQMFSIAGTMTFDVLGRGKLVCSGNSGFILNGNVYNGRIQCRALVNTTAFSGAITNIDGGTFSVACDLIDAAVVYFYGTKAVIDCPWITGAMVSDPTLFGGGGELRIRNATIGSVTVEGAPAVGAVLDNCRITGNLSTGSSGVVVVYGGLSVGGTTAAGVTVVQTTALADGVTHGGPNAKLRLGSADPAAPAMRLTQSDANGWAFVAENDTTATAGVGGAVKFDKGLSAAGMYVISGIVGGIDSVAAATVSGYSAGTAPLQPTTPGRKLDVSATGEAGVDWANVGSPTTAVSLTNTQLGPTERAAAADKLLGRNLAGGSDGGRTVKDALRAARNKVAFDVPAPGQFTVFQEDDTQVAWVGDYTRAAVNALVGVDPT